MYNYQNLFFILNNLSDTFLEHINVSKKKKRKLNSPNLSFETNISINIKQLPKTQEGNNIYIKVCVIILL